MDLQLESICLPDPLTAHLSSNEPKVFAAVCFSKSGVTKVLTLAGESYHDGCTGGWKDSLKEENKRFNSRQKSKQKM